MSSRTATRLASGIGGICLVLLILSLVLLALDWKAIDSPGTAQLPYFIAAPIIGALGVADRGPPPEPSDRLVASDDRRQQRDLANCQLCRYPRDIERRLTPRLGGVGSLGVQHHRSDRGTLDAFLILVFPDGRLLPGRRWRWAARVVSAATAVALLASSIAVTSQQLSPRLPSVPNPVAVDALNNVTSGNGPINAGVLLLLITVLAAVVVRLRRSRGVERIQMRWFSYVAATSVLVIVAGFVVNSANEALGNNISNVGFGFGFYLLVPATIGLAVMRYGLYDLDLFIRRTLVYGTLAVFITAVYVGIAVGIGTLVGSGGKPNLALSILATAIVAIGFQPVRERVQKVANRLVYGNRATPYEVLSEFSGRVAETYAADEVLPRMAQVLKDGTGAESATVWLRGTEELRPAATFPNGVETHVAVPMRNGTLPALEDATRVVEVRHQGELLAH